LAPQLSRCCREDLAADLPVEQDQLAIHGERSPELRILNALLQLGQKLAVTGRGGRADFTHAARLRSDRNLLNLL
jgi:hypothetical protein